MFAKVFNPDQKEPRDSMGDSMSVDGSNSGLFEELMSDVSAEDQQRIREGHAASMRKLGYAESTIELMLNPQPVPAQSIAD